MPSPVKAAIAALLALGLAGCVDVAVDIDVTSPTTARATMTQDMNADFYTLIKLNQEQAEEEDAEAEPVFCAEGDLTEHIDGTATCVLAEEGAFATLDLGQDEGGITFTDEEDGLVRIAVSTAELRAQADIEEELDAETRDLVNAFFSGRDITLTFSGAEVIDTNMTLSEDETSASQTLPLLDLINGTADLPDELYAVVRAP